ncbi:MAG: Fic family protein [Steroidobacteraceae bacterium]
MMSATSPANRAALAMFVVAEVHPFTDGNGRTARLAMNLFLTQAGFTRIIIPTVFRDDYISALKAMSINALPTPLARMLGRAARFSRWVNMTSKAAAFNDLKRSNALGRPETDKLMFDDEESAGKSADQRA